MGQGPVNETQTPSQRWSTSFGGEGSSEGLRCPGHITLSCWSHQTSQKSAWMGDADPRWTPLCTYPRSLLVGELFSVAHPSPSGIPLCGRISLLSGKCLQSGVDCVSSHHPRVPAEFPADRVSHFCIWFVQSGRVRLPSKNISCGWLTEEELGGFAYAQDFSLSSARRSRTSKFCLHLSVHTPLPGFLTKPVFQGKPRRGRNGVTSFSPFHLIGMWLFCQG